MVVLAQRPDLSKRSKYIGDLHRQIKKNFKTSILGKEFIITPGVFSPIGTLASEFLARNLIVSEDEIVLDLGTGIGIQAIVAAQKAERVIATDVNPRAIVCATENIKRNNLENKIEVR